MSAKNHLTPELEMDNNRIARSRRELHPSPRARRVLLVDDDQVLREVGKEILETLGYEVSTAEDGEEAIRLYERQWSRFDIILLDMAMPGMDGGEVYDLLKTINPRVRVLLLSGHSPHGKAREILERGCNGFLQKPFGLGQLSRSIHEVCETTVTREGESC